MFAEESISLDAQATILACSSIGLPGRDATRPFGPRGWAKLRGRVESPQAMLGVSTADLATMLGDDATEAARLARLLARGAQLAFELDRLRSRGVWVVTLADAGYPTRLREGLGPDAPPVLFGAGERSFLSAGGVAIIGSRNVDERGLAFTRELAGAVARGGSPVVSGGARGVDQEAMRSALDAGGTVVGALPEGVESRIREPTARSALADGTAVLVSPFHPSAGFSAGAAMGRNRIVYALADVAVVVSSAARSGGTWAGAVEALVNGRTPVLVRSGPDVPGGNDELIARGARPLSLEVMPATTTADRLVSAAGGPAARAAEAEASYEQQELTLAD